MDVTIPSGCTLPTAERPLRVAEFDDLFAEAVTATERVGPRRLRLTLKAQPPLAARAADLLVRETACCSFFTLTLTAAGGALTLDIEAPPEYADATLFDALAARAAAGADSS